jgi:hypothetical protein
MDTRGGNGIFFGHGRRLSLGEDTIDAEARDRVLGRIAQGRENQVLITSKLGALPSWVTVPFQDDQEAFNVAIKAFQEADPTVTALEHRLSSEPGPVWRNLSPQEEAALTNWTKSADTMASLVERHYPSDITKDIKNIALLLIGVGAIFGPLLWTSDGESASDLFRLRPLVPSGPRPMGPFGPVPTALPLPPGVLPFRPPMAAPPPPGVLRPSVTTFAPGMPIPPPGTIPGVPSPTPMPRFARPLMPPAGAAPGTFIYPRYAP